MILLDRLDLCSLNLIWMLKVQVGPFVHLSYVSGGSLVRFGYRYATELGWRLFGSKQLLPPGMLIRYQGFTIGNTSSFCKSKIYITETIYNSANIRLYNFISTSEAHSLRLQKRP